MRLLLRFMGFLFAAGTIVFLVGVAAVAGLIWHFSKDLPDYSQLQDYEPAVMTRVHAADGSLLGEYSKERRLYLPIQAIPKPVINAFLAAEDKNFYEHGGIDFTGMARAAILYAQNFGSNRRPQGASTITQQVAKNFLLTNEVSFDRKIKEALLAMRIERTYTKDKILELYLNEIYLGLSAYGIAAASLVYFDKSVNELTIAEAAYLAALPKAPSSLHPVRNRDRAIERRNYVIDRLAENGWIKQADAVAARKEPLNVTSRSNAAHIFAGEYFAEEVRRDIFERYGEKKLYEGGLSVRTSLDPKLQMMARKAMVAGLVNFDEAQGWRGAVTKLDLNGGDWGVKLAEVKSLGDISPWRMAVVLETSDQSARIGFQPPRELGGASGNGRLVLGVLHDAAQNVARVAVLLTHPIATRKRRQQRPADLVSGAHADALRELAEYAGQGARGVVGKIRQIIFPRDLLGFGFGRLERPDRRKRAVLQNRQMRKQVEALEDDADLLAQLAQVGRGVVDLRAVDADDPGLYRLQPVDAAEHRALARAGAADHRDDLALGDIERDVLQHLDRAVALVDPVDFNERHRASARSSGSIARGGSTSRNRSRRR